MNGKFFVLKKEKQDRMINAALKVFAMQGYRHASTDEIVKEAGISKGLLFHYFESKAGLYAFVYDYSVRFMTMELGIFVSPGKKDMFDLFRQIEQARVKLMKSYPYIQQFLNRSMTENVSEALLATEEKRAALEKCYADLYEQADFSLLPPGADGPKLWKMLELTVKGLMTEKFESDSFQPEMLYEEILEYLDLLKKTVRNSD